MMIEQLQKISLGCLSVIAFLGMYREAVAVESFGIGKNAVKINLSHQGIERLEIFLKNLPKVRYLNLAGNELTTLTDFPHAPELRELVLCRNNLSNLEGFPERLEFLQTLNLIKNPPLIKEKILILQARGKNKARIPNNCQVITDYGKFIVERGRLKAVEGPYEGRFLDEVVAEETEEDGI